VLAQRISSRPIGMCDRQTWFLWDSVVKLYCTALMAIDDTQRIEWLASYLVKGQKVVHQVVAPGQSRVPGWSSRKHGNSCQSIPMGDKGLTRLPEFSENANLPRAVRNSTANLLAIGMVQRIASKKPPPPAPNNFPPMAPARRALSYSSSIHGVVTCARVAA